MALKIESNIKLFHAIFPSFIRMSILIKNSKKTHKTFMQCEARQGMTRGLFVSEKVAH